MEDQPHGGAVQDVPQRGDKALAASEAVYDDIDAAQGRSNVDIEKHLRRAEVKTAQAQAWFLLAAQASATGARNGSAERMTRRHRPTRD